MGVTDNQFTEAEKAAEAEAAASAQPAVTATTGVITNVTATASTPPTAPSAIEKDTVAVESSLQAKVGSWLKDVYSQNKLLFYTIIPLAGIIYLVLKFHNILIDLLLGGAKQEITQAQQTDAKLAQQADATKSQADALVQQADSLSTQQPPVDPNWDKK